ncbi:DUF501 domain-containing protein [Halanaerobium salsuginis]|uniref:DUF501 domain-containing protein n=1 Tax=Halanaerobium salsuginis TaxID=29563 RepID=A0A1I4KS97_9FIRM|nr:DUF501 domain-containing protein [Halanaerobium salsuginis]SFL81664.1 hypothetical protein SAMN02983006_02102 [Halanaerobium salsuginis]
MKSTDHKIVELQLKRKIDNFSQIAHYCPFKYPAVVEVNPFTAGIPAPTIYWLSCPALNYQVDRLESESNLIDELGQKLKNDLQFKQQLAKAHQDYARQRRQLLTAKAEEQAQKISVDLLNTLLYSGVGGIKEQLGIKCLHTHLAHFLVTGSNPVGKIVFAKVSWPEECLICQERTDKLESSSN